MSSWAADRPKLRRIATGVYRTLDGQFTITRAEESYGPRGGKVPVWWVINNNDRIDGDGPYRSLLLAALSVASRIRGWSRLAPTSGTVYLLHFDRPFGHARHYLGWTNRESVEYRLEEHRNGVGANLMKHVVAAGITFRLARTWNGGRTKERQLKKQLGASRLCPICKGET